MKKILKKYRYIFKSQAMIILILMILLCIPSFSLTFAKLRSFIDEDYLTKTNAELHQTPRTRNGLLSYIQFLFDDQDMLNRTFIMDESRVFGPFYEEDEKQYFIIQLDDDFFVVAESEDAQLYRSTGGLAILDDKMYKEASKYIKESKLNEDLLDGEISLYYYRDHYVGDLKHTTFILHALFMLTTILSTCLILYFYIKKSLYHRFILRYEDLNRYDKEIMDYEVTGLNLKDDKIVFGRRMLYFYQGIFTNVIQYIKYDDIIWFYVDNRKATYIVIYDKYGILYRIKAKGSRKDLEKVLLRLSNKSPYASQGYKDEYIKLKKENIFQLVALCKKRRRDALEKNMKRDSHDE